MCFVVLSLAFALGGCGPIGGRSGLAPAKCITVQDGDCVTPEAFAESAAESVEEYRLDGNFQNQWGLSHIKADAAYSNLALLKGEDSEPGAGVTIGFIDTGIDQDHPVFAGKTVTEELLMDAPDETGAGFSHGTAVASIAAGGRFSHRAATQGVAWGADIAMFAIPLGSGDGVYRPIPVEALGRYDAEDAALYEQVLSWRNGARKVDILNLSFGFQGLIDRYTEQELRDNYASTIAAFAQVDADEKTILVWAAGNSHGDECDPATTDYCRYVALNAVSPSVLSGLTAYIEELRGHTIAVAALSPADGQITSFSNRCGIAADYCIAAPGQEVRFAYFGPHPVTGPGYRGFADGGGTSFAAPMVSGGLAIMQQLFRDQLSNTELVTRLFETADKTGFYADSAIYGQGSMDLGAATSPVGVLEFPVGDSVGQNGFSFLSTRFRPGSAFGDGLQQSLAARQIMALDDLGAPFWYGLGSFTAAAKGMPVAARLRGFLAAEPGWAGPAGATAMARGQAGSEANGAPVTLHIARLESTAEVRGSHLALAEGGVKATLAGQGGLSAAAFTTKGDPGQKPAVGAALSWRRAGSPLGLRAGWIGERETLLGSVGEGAFGDLAGDTAFVGVDASTGLGRWRVGANAELGMVTPAARGGLVTRVSSLATSAFALHATRALAGSGALRVSVSQPLRVESGRASLTVPAGRTKAGAVLYDSVPAELAPSGRQMDIAGQWHRPLGRGELRLGAVYSHRPGHSEAAGPETTFLAGWRRDF